jgi:hypothetical protein
MLGDGVNSMTAVHELSKRPQITCALGTETSKEGFAVLGFTIVAAFSKRERENYNTT